MFSATMLGVASALGPLRHERFEPGVREEQDDRDGDAADESRNQRGPNLRRPSSFSRQIVADQRRPETDLGAECQSAANGNGRQNQMIDHGREGEFPNNHLFARRPENLDQIGQYDQ